MPPERVTPRRLVFHTASLGGGGAERVFVIIASALAERGHEVTYLTWNGRGPNAALLSPRVTVIDLAMPLRGEGFGKLASLRGLWNSARILVRLKPEALYSAPEFANLVMALALLLARSSARFLPSFHAAGSLPSGTIGARLAVLLSRIVVKRASRAIAVSAGVGRDLVSRGFPPEKVVIINNPLPVLTAPPASYSWQITLDGMGEGPVIATAGRLVAVKDHSTLLKAFSLLRAQRPARLVIFGEGPLHAALRAEADALGVGSQVLLPGYVDHPAACYAVADLFVLSSRSEGFGNVLIEAMAAGVPVVSTDAPHGPREILADGAYGNLVPVGDAAALAEAMERGLERPADPDRLRRRAADFAVDAIADRYEAALS